MDLEKIQMPKEKAKAEWKLYNDLIKKRHEKYLEDMKKCMYQLSKGNELIDIYKVMEKAGINKNYHPKLAISRADWKEVCFCKKDSGRGVFSKEGSEWGNKKNGDIDLQPHTFVEWARAKQDLKTDKRTYQVDSSWQIADQKVKTKVPIIPVQLWPEDSLTNYYILWEVDNWEELPKQDDPILLKRITENLFVILGCWDLTELEQSIISGR